MLPLPAAMPPGSSPFLFEAVDTVAAGDCFNGAFAVALLEGSDPWAAARFASAAAALSVTRPGAQASMPTRAEVESFSLNANDRLGHLPFDLLPFQFGGR